MTTHQLILMCEMESSIKRFIEAPNYARLEKTLGCIVDAFDRGAIDALQMTDEARRVRNAYRNRASLRIAS